MVRSAHKAQVSSPGGDSDRPRSFPDGSKPRMFSDSTKRIFQATTDQEQEQEQENVQQEDINTT